MSRQSAAWGIYDTRDKCWMGNKDGPNRYEGTLKGISAKKRCMAAATILNAQFETYRFRARPLPAGVNKHAGTVTSRLTFAQAMKRLGI